MNLKETMLLHQAIYCQTKGIELPEVLKQKLESSSIEEQAEAEINLIEAEYFISSLNED